MRVVNERKNFMEPITIGTYQTIVIQVIGGLIFLPRSVKVKEIELVPFDDKCYEDPRVLVKHSLNSMETTKRRGRY